MDETVGKIKSLYTEKQKTKKKKEVTEAENKHGIQINKQSEGNNQISTKTKGANVLTEKIARNQLTRGSWWRLTMRASKVSVVIRN